MENNQNNNSQNQAETEKKFTQADIDAIVEGRLAREKQKYSDYEVLKEKANELAKLKDSNKTESEKTAEQLAELKKQLGELTKQKTISEVRSKVAEKMKIPVSLLTGEDEESCEKQAKAILDFAGGKNANYPGTKHTEHRQQHSENTQNDEAMREFAQKIFGGK